MIIPAILEKDWDLIEDRLKLSQNFTRNIHIDIIDGKFAPNSTCMDFEFFKKYSGSFNMEAHLMVEEPINYLTQLADAGFNAFLGHVEKMSDQVEFVARAEALGEVGLCLDLATSLDEIKVSFEDLERILLMAVPAGKSGQNFDESVLAKIKAIREKSLIKIEVDGGINDTTVLLAKNAGADIFCANSFLFDHNPHDNYLLLEELIGR